MQKDLSHLRSFGQRADELFKQHQQEIFLKTDRLFSVLMPLQWLAGIVMALTISPRTWAGQASQINVHVWAAIFIGGAITIFPVWMTRAWPGAAATRHVIAVAQMLMSALLIDITGGRIETHFHVFGSLVILSFYRDWRVLVPATLVVGLDHLLRGIYWPYSVYGVLTASPWRSFEHAGWVLFEDIFLFISCRRNIREMQFIANRTAELEDNEQIFREIFEGAPLGMALVDLNQNFLRANPAYCRLLGYSEEELTQRTTWDITLPEDIERGNEISNALLDGGPPVSFEKRYIRKTGEMLWVSRTACLIRDHNGKPQHYLVMVEDITQRKNNDAALEAKEEADRANRAKSEFLSRMSHELRTPLNAILGFGQLLEKQVPTDVQRTRVGYITSAGRHLLNLINEVLDISRIEADRLQLSPEPVCLAEALPEAIELIRPLAAERSIKLLMSSPLDPEWFVMADKQRFKQVLLNLMSNAVKYTPIRGKVSISCDASGKNSLRVAVTDTGSGIAADKLARLFTPFDRLGAEYSSVEGTGLGLALSQRLMHAMGGSISATSKLGRGSTFWIELPWADSSLAAGRAELLEQQERRVFDSKRKILYIEDNLSNLTLIEEILREQPEIELLSAMQGQLGLDLARKHLPNLILLDLHLPDLPGWEVLSRLRSQEDTRDIPVVIISADATNRQIEQLMATGARAYLTKPLDVNEFFRVLEETTFKSAAA